MNKIQERIKELEERGLEIESENKGVSTDKLLILNNDYILTCALIQELRFAQQEILKMIDEVFTKYMETNDDYCFPMELLGILKKQIKERGDELR